MNSLKKIFTSIFSVVIIFTFFYFLLFLNESLPNMSKVLSSFKHNHNILTTHVQISLSTLIPGLFLGISFGVLLGLLTGYYYVFDLVFSPILNFIRAIPPIALAPIFIIIIGIGFSSKVTIITLGTFFPVWINTFQGMKSIPEKIHVFCKDFKLSYLQKFLKVFLPYITPSIIAGIRISIATSLVMLFIAEWIASSEGIGYFMALAHTLNNIDDLLVGVLILGFISLIIDFVFVKLTNILFPWIAK